MTDFLVYQLYFYSMLQRCSFICLFLDFHVYGLVLEERSILSYSPNVPMKDWHHSTGGSNLEASWPRQL